MSGIASALACDDLKHPDATRAEASIDSESPADAKASPTSAPAFIGAARCAECHAQAFRAWQGSHHDLAMAGPEAIVGEIGGPPLEHAGERWSVERTGDAVFVRHEDAAGEVDRRRVVASFGVEPLQQLLVEGEAGRLHAWPIAWDARPAAEGGQRWYGLGEDASAPPLGDPLHRDGPAYEWNSQCAACHSTALTKGYDEAAHAFDTQSAEIDVACEACHGPGSQHAALARAGEASAWALPVRFEAWAEGAWRRSEGMRIAARVEERDHDAQLEVCAPCHSRRSVLLDPPPVGAAFLDGHSPRLLEPGLYFDDGQIADEVYVWGSFQQSRMAAAGVRCSDCHDPHTLAPRREGNALCTGCHASDAFDVPSHRGHPGKGGAARAESGRACVDCHMPSRTYMGVDARRDHSFPMPRPTRSAALAAPDPCLACHADRSAAWASAAIADWRGDQPDKPHWADHLVDGGAARPPAEAWLDVARASDATDFVRGGAWRRVAFEALELPAVAELALRVREGGDLERLGLVDLALRYENPARARLLLPMLGDPRRAIRIAAAEALSRSGLESLAPADRSRLARALREYRTAQEANAERPESQTNQALLAAAYGDLAEARAILDRVIARAPYFVPARVNRADLARAEGDETTALAQLEEAVRLTPEDARVRRAYGFALHRAGDLRGALAQLEQAQRDAPGDPDGVLAYALALDGLGDREGALDQLGQAFERGLERPALYDAFVSMALESGRIDRAASALVEWRARFPADPRLEVFSGIAEGGVRVEGGAPTPGSAPRQASPD